MQRCIYVDLFKDPEHINKEDLSECSMTSHRVKTVDDVNIMTKSIINLNDLETDTAQSTHFL